MVFLTALGFDLSVCLSHIKTQWPCVSCVCVRPCVFDLQHVQVCKCYIKIQLFFLRQSDQLESQWKYLYIYMLYIYIYLAQYIYIMPKPLRSSFLVLSMLLWFAFCGLLLEISVQGCQGTAPARHLPRSVHKHRSLALVLREIWGNHNHMPHWCFTSGICMPHSILPSSAIIYYA